MRECSYTDSLLQFDCLSLSWSSKRQSSAFACGNGTAANGEVIPHVSPTPNTRLIGYHWNLLPIPILDHFVLMMKLAHRTYAAASAIGVVGYQVPVSRVNHLLACSSLELKVSADILACLALQVGWAPLPLLERWKRFLMMFFVRLSTALLQFCGGGNKN